MKTLQCFWKPWVGPRLSIFSLVFLVALVAAAAAVPATRGAEAPSIRSIRLEGTNVVVTAQVPSGVRRVTLECQSRLERLGGGAWEPRAVARLDGTASDVEIRLAVSQAGELMRLRADSSDPLPASFYAGTNAFFEAGGGSSALATPGVVDTRDGTGTPEAQSASRDVVESDIWKVQGQRLYFFNQLRGLQIINISNPDAPVVQGTLELPAAGEDMYLLDDSYAVLLANETCDYTQSQVLVVSVDSAKPSVVARLPVPGSILESRLVGSALYVASQTFRPVPSKTDGSWEWVTMVSSFDLSVPAKAVARNSLAYSGYGNVVSANDTLLFVVTQDPNNWWQSKVRTIDITAPDGTMHDYQTVRTAGRVPDKFKLRWESGVLTTISEDWRQTSNRRVTTLLETFRLPDPRAAGPGGVSKLGSLELGGGEQLHATRFDGHLVYVVTFFRIDPLWVVDLSNPASPHIVGSVNVPGWSTFIQPLGNRLVSIGIESNRVAVSLFDIGNPAAPALLSRVRLGQNYSWSEANWDEKAFSVLPDAGLILVPFSGDTTNGYASSVQLVDLNDKSLAARGVIQDRFQPRRATLYQNRVLSISEWQLLSVDASDRDQPFLTATLPLAWPVDRVFLHGDFVVEVSASDGWSWWAGSVNPVLRSASAAVPNQVLSALALPQLPVLGAAQRGDRLYLLQGQQAFFYPAIPLASPDGAAADVPQTKTVLSVVSLENLPALQLSGQVETAADADAFGGDFQAVWPKDDLIVFSGGSFGFRFPCFDCPIPLAADAMVGRIAYPWWGWGGSGGRLLAFDVKDPAAPALASSVNLASNVWWNFSQPFTANGLVYLSHQTSEFFPLDSDQAAGAADAAGNAVIGVQIIAPPPGTWIARSYLDVVDYADAKQPLVRRPVNIPGQLNGISHQGSVLYTIGTHWKADLSDWTEFLDASAYDGVAAHLIDSLALSNSWPRPLLVTDAADILIGRTLDVTADPASGAGVLDTWRLADSGKFQRTGSVRLPLPASALAVYGKLLAAQETDQSVVLFDDTDASALRQVGSGRPAGCVWFDLTKADGALGRGLWVSLGAYGVATIPAKP